MMTTAERDKLLAEFDAQLDDAMEVHITDLETGDVAVSDVYTFGPNLDDLEASEWLTDDLETF